MIEDLCFFAEAVFGPKRNSGGLTMPPEAALIWDWFRDLDGTRNIGTQANSITYAEISAYRTIMEIHMFPWQIRALRSLDDVVMSMRAKKNKGSRSKQESEPSVLVDKSDGAGVKSIMESLAAKSRKKK